MNKQSFSENKVVRPKLTQQVIDYFSASATISGTIWRSHEVASLAKFVLEKPILDLGCGNGTFSKTVFSGKIDYGLDLSPDEIDKAQKNKIYKHYLIDDAHDIGLPDQSIQTVFSNSVFEHISNLIPVLAEINRVLKPGGTLIFTTHSPLSKKFYGVYLLKKIGLISLAKIYQKIFCKMLKLHTLWSEKTWRKNLKNSGFQVVQMDSIVSPQAAFWYEFFMPITFLQNRIPLLKKIKLTKLVLSLLRIDFSKTHQKGRNFFIIAKKMIST